MNPVTRMGRRVSALAAALVLMVCASREAFAEKQTPYVWKSAGIGTAAPEDYSWDQKTLKITGAGAGLNVKGNDQFQFVYLTRQAGDFEVVVRLADFTGSGDAGAGIMARIDDTPHGAMAALFFNRKDNSVNWKSRISGATPQETPRMFSAGIPLAQRPPLWLRMVRLGKNFAVYKSRDGQLWSMISNVSGGPVALAGRLKLGFFVFSAAEDKPVTATFDSIRIGAAQMRYKTSWVGNTFGCRGEDNHVSNGLSALWVAPDGTCYASSYWDEAGQPVTSYRNGRVVRGLPIGTPQTAEGGITGDATNLFVATVGRITVLDPAAPDYAPRPLCLAVSLLSTNTHNSVVSGMASSGRELFVADSRENLIRVASLEPVGTRGSKGESAELVSRAFPFERPGSMTLDQRGDLWIIQRGNDFPIGGALTAKYPAAVKCYATNGTFTGRAITDVVNPRALGYDAVRDQLLVAENGPALNVRFYSGLATNPAVARTFGEQGGIFSGKHPGLVNDPAAGGYARFAGIAGVGMDAQGNLYVGGGFQGTDLRMFTPAGKLGWMVNSLMFCNTYDVDSASDGAEIYGTYNHLHLDLSKTEPGQEQRYVGYNWDLRNFGEPVRAGGSQSIVRRLGDKRSAKRLVMFTSGQGTVGDILIFRYDGELAIPAGDIREHGTAVWSDANGNGKAEPEEITKMASAISWITGLCVDSKGDIWAATATTGGSFMRHFTFKGFNASGVPLYSGVRGEGYEDLRFPEEGDKTSGWGMASRLDYDADRDILVAFYPAVARTGEGDTSTPQYVMARYDNWSQGNRASKWKVKALRPETDPDYFMYEVKLYPYSGYMGMEIAGDYVFCAYLFGEVHVFDLNTGKLVETLSMGPEVNGQSAWEDAAMGLRAFKRKNGDYLIFTENSGWGGKNNFFRWRP